MNGASLNEIAAVLGHKTLAMVQRYAHLSESHLAGLAGKMADKFITQSAPGDPEATD